MGGHCQMWLPAAHAATPGPLCCLLHLPPFPIPIFLELSPCTLWQLTHNQEALMLSRQAG